MLEDIRSRIVEARRARPCSVGLWRSGLSEADQRAFDDLMLDEDLQTRELYLELKGAGLPVAEYTFGSHRRGRCACAR